jgi:hypothetical protein
VRGSGSGRGERREVGKRGESEEVGRGIRGSFVVIITNYI